MKIDIQEIINQKIKDMEENRVVEKTIQDTLEKTIVNAITSALDGYALKRKIEEKIEKEVSSVVADIGFTAYNSFIAEKVKAITEGVCRKDIAEKIQKTFDEMLIIKRDSIKLSEICDKYRDWICNEVEEQEKYSLKSYWVSVEEHHWLTFKFGKEAPSYGCRSDEYSVEFTIHRGFDDKSIGSIGTIRINGNDIKDELHFGHMPEIKLLLFNIYYNKTPIEIDVESEDDMDNSFDVDI